MRRPFSFNRQLDVPFDRMVHVLRDEPGVLLGLARDAALRLTQRGMGDGVHVIASTPTPTTLHDVDLVLGPMQQVDKHAVMVPISWESVDGAPWFPHVTGEIEVVEQDDRRPWVEVTWFGTYEPPLGRLGDLVTHIAVEETLQQFFDAACGHALDTLAAEAMLADG